MPEGAPSAAPLGLAEAIGWVGCDVDDVSGAPVGRVRGVFADPSGEPAWVVVGLERRVALFARRRAALVAVPLRDCAAAAGRIWTAHGARALRTAPTVDPARPLLREHELVICAHYGIGERVGRAAEVRGRAEASITSQPAELLPGFGCGNSYFWVECPP